jgi:DNA-binding response OmpR family regulator
VWEHPHEYDTKLVEVFIGRLRKKLGEPPLIQTIRHVGYTIDRPEGKIPVRRGANSQRRG